MSLPLLHLRGLPYEQGRQQGEALRERPAYVSNYYRIVLA
jgi:hypothetical protein